MIGSASDAGEKPRLLIVAGPNGSGKTTITRRGLRHVWFDGCDYINPDDMARDEFGDWNDPAAVLAAAKKATALREACLRDGRSFAFETVFSGPDKIDFVRRGLAAGFFVRLFFVCTETPTINAARVARRVMQGGHEVPLRKIIDRWGRSITNGAAVAYMSRPRRPRRPAPRPNGPGRGADGRGPVAVMLAVRGGGGPGRLPGWPTPPTTGPLTAEPPTTRPAGCTDCCGGWRPGGWPASGRGTRSA